MRTNLGGLLFTAIALLPATGAFAAEAFPQRPIHLVVGFPAGGASDVAARAVAEKMAEKLGKPVVVENKPGAASNIAADMVAKSAPDGYTVLFGTISLSINKSLYQNLNYDALKAFTPVSQLASAPFVLVVNPSSPIKSVKELIAASKDVAPEKAIHYATAGNGSGSHLFTELLAHTAGITLSHVPYRGAAPAMVDVLGGQVPLTFDNIITTLPLIESGKLRALAVSSKQRSTAAPDIPTLDEAGVPGYDASSWFGLFVPAGTPGHVVKALHEAATHAVHTPGVTDTFKGVGAEPQGTSPQEFNDFFQSEVRKWSEVVDRAKVQIN